MKFLTNPLRGFVALVISTVALSTQADCSLKQVHDGTVTSQSSGLMWRQCLIGQTGRQCEIGEADGFNWVNALNRARGSELAGFYNWRMPKINELESLMTFCIKQTSVISGISDGLIWSASANLDFATEAWSYNIATGKREIARRHEAVFVLLVRDIE